MSFTQEKSIRVGIIGAGETGTPLLRQLMAAPFITLVAVADLDNTQPGMVLARMHDIPTTTRFLDIAEKGNEVDIIIDVTGVPLVRDALRTHMIETQNDHTIIMHERIALLMLSLSSGKLVQPKHTELSYS